jgi:lactoylglutathione lyase
MSTTASVLPATHLSLSLTYRDVEAAITWFSEVLGFGVAHKFESEGKVRGAVVTGGSIRIVLNQDDGKLGWDRVKGQGMLITINVESTAAVDAAAERVRASGIELLDEPADRPWGARTFQFRDNDGFKFSISAPLG